MTSSEQGRDELLVQYLLGSLPEEEAERLDELSIADDEFASRLHAVENDLVDGYVRGELFGETLHRFRSFYLSSTIRREKVRFAETLFASEKDRAAAAQVAPAARPPQQYYGRRFFSLPQLFPQWALGSAALILLLAAGTLFVDNLRLRRQVNEADAGRAALGEREQQLQTQLVEQRSASAATLRELEQVRESQMNLDQIKTASLILSPPTRGPARIPTFSVPAGTNLAVLLLSLESDDYPAYRAELKDPVTGRTVWRSGDLKAEPAGAAKAISIGFRAGLLKSQDYIVELTGMRAGGIPELISTYPFRAVVR